MRAVVCTRYGPPDVLELREMARPVPDPDQILVEVKASTVAVADIRCRSFDVPPSYWVPARLALGVLRPRASVPGAEFAGTVVAVGPDVEGWTVGDEVFGYSIPRFGAYAEYLAVRLAGGDNVVAAKPASLDWGQAAAVPIGAMTALHFLRSARLEPGHEILIYGASGSVGTYAVQLAEHMGARVTAVCSGRNVELVRSLGADEVVDYTRADFADRGRSYDVVFDAVGKAPFKACLRALEPQGSFLHVVGSPGTAVRLKWVSLTSGRRTVAGGPDNDPADLAYLGELIQAGHLRPVIDRTYPLKDIVAAHRYVDTGRKRGNVVVRVDDDG